MGGWVESEYNLSQEGSCWLFGGATVLESAVVAGDSIVCRNSLVRQRAVVSGKSVLSVDSHITNNAAIYNSILRGHIRIHGDAVIRNTEIKADITIEGDAQILSSDDFLVASFEISGKVETILFYRTSNNTVNVQTPLLGKYGRLPCTIDRLVVKMALLSRLYGEAINLPRMRALVNFAKSYFDIGD